MAGPSPSGSDGTDRRRGPVRRTTASEEPTQAAGGDPTESTDYPARRWLVLGVAWASFFAIAAVWYVMPTLQPQIRAQYAITAPEFRLALTIPFLVAGLLALPGGVVADRVGIRWGATVGISVAGAGFLLRSRPGGFLSLVAPMVLIGVGMGLTMPNLPKLVSVWFPPEETGLATGIYSTGLLGGFSTGLVLAPYLPGWTTGNLLLGGVVLGLAVLFYVVVRDAPPGEKRPRDPLFEGVQRALRSRRAWAAALGVMGGSAGMVAIQGELPAGLLAVYAIPPVTGGRIASVISFSGLVGSVTIPALATRFGRRKATLLIASIGFGVIELSVWLTGEPAALYAGSAVAGYLAGGALPILLEVPTWLPRVSATVERQHVGGVSGLLTSLMNLGGFAGLPLVVGPIIESGGYTLGFAVAALIFAMQGVFGLLVDFPTAED